MPRFLAPLVLVWLLVLPAAAAPPGMADDPRIDENGRDIHVYPPDVLFDYLHVRLDVTIPDMTKPQFSARERLTVAPVGTPRSSIELRAGRGLKFSSVTLDGSGQGTPLTFSHQNQILAITFPHPIPIGQRTTLVIDYSANRPGGGGAGLTFSKDDPDTPELDPMCHAQGQPEANHLWFPIHDFPNERLTSEVVATVPDGYQAISNGRLLAVTRHPGPADQPGSSTYHWLQDKPHASYLITLVVGKFDVVNVGGPDSKRPGLWIPVYGPLGSAGVLKRNFSATPEMIAYFEQIFDEPFAWDKYAQVLCRDFAAGAMENTSCTTFASGVGLGGRRGAEGVIAHELCHQWFGDLVGYKSWEHLWLGEGWATFGEALWAEHARGTIGYERAVLSESRQAKLGSTGSLPNTGGAVATNLYAEPDIRFNPLVVYAKGGWTLHSLRSQLGDDAFFQGVRLYLHRFHFQQVETDDFRHCLEEASGRSLEQFFDQFVYRPGIPHLAVDLTWDDATHTLGVSVEQTQKINADNPAFSFSLPILADLGEGKTQALTMDIDTRQARREFKLDAKPTKVVVDPHATVLCDAKIRQPLDKEVSWWFEQLRTGPTEFARAQAADALADLGTAPAILALAQAIVTPSAAPAARQDAAAALLATARNLAGAGHQPGPRDQLAASAR